MEGDVRLYLRIRGRVQGVSFRYFARRQAQVLGLRGWVRNASDGSVEAVAEGPREAVNRFVDWARLGPSQARVDDLEVREEQSPGELQGFRIVG